MSEAKKYDSEIRQPHVRTEVSDTIELDGPSSLNKDSSCDNLERSIYLWIEKGPRISAAHFYRNEIGNSAH